MIIDKLKNAALYYTLSPTIKKALNYLEENELKVKEPGKYSIDGDRIFVLISEYKTKPKEEANWEAHRKYIDIQYIISGAEKMGYTSVENITTTIEYSDENDIFFGEGNGDYVTVSEGSFVIFMPQDAHMPSITEDKKQDVKKAVIKILID